MCKTIAVTIPEIEAMRLAHYMTIGSECTTSLSSYLEKLYVYFNPLLLSLSFYKNSKTGMLTLESYQNRNYAEIGWDARVALGVYGAFSSNDYIKAQKMRYMIV